MPDEPTYSAFEACMHLGHLWSEPEDLVPDLTFIEDMPMRLHDPDGRAVRWVCSRCALGQIKTYRLGTERPKPDRFAVPTHP